MPATYCDRHPTARAVNVYTHAGKFLFFCGHCSTKNALPLATGGWTCDPVTQPAAPSKVGV